METNRVSKGVFASVLIGLALVSILLMDIEEKRFSSKAWRSRKLWDRGRRVESAREVLKIGLPKSEVLDLMGPAEQCRGEWVEWEYLEGTHGKWLSVRFEKGRLAEVELNQGDSYPSKEDPVDDYTARVRR